MASIDTLKASDGTGNASVATVQSVRSPGATTLVVDTVQGINTKFHATMGTPHTFVDPVTSETITVISEASAVDFVGHVDGSNLEIDTIAPGFTDAGSAVNDIVIIKPTTQWADELAEVLEVTHNDSGTLKDEAVTPEKLITGTGTSWAWQSWTPALTASTNPTLGTNSVAEGRYTQIGKTVICQIDIKFGTSGTNAGSGTYYISLPVAAKTAISGYQVMPIGFLRALDASAGYGAVFFPELETSTTAQLVYYQGIGGTGPASGVAHNNPWAWSTSDIVCAGTITYEAA